MSFNLGDALGQGWNDAVGLYGKYLENQGETRAPTPDPAVMTAPETTAVDESGRSMTAQPNVLATTPTWVWFAGGAVLLLLLVLLVVALVK